MKISRRGRGGDEPSRRRGRRSQRASAIELGRTRVAEPVRRRAVSRRRLPAGSRNHAAGRRARCCSPLSMSWSAHLLRRSRLRRSGADPVRLLRSALERAPGELELRGETGAAALRARARTLTARRARRVGNRDDRSTRLGAIGMLAAASSIRSTPAAQPEPGRRRTVELLDQPVVAPPPPTPDWAPSTSL